MSILDFFWIGGFYLWFVLFDDLFMIYKKKCSVGG